MFIVSFPRAVARSLATAASVCSLMMAQSYGHDATSMDGVRKRVENSVERQRTAVARMGRSIALQKRAVVRPPTVVQSLTFEDFHRRIESVSQAAESCNSLPTSEITSLVDMAAAQTSVSPDLIRSVMRQESGFRPCVVSPKGAMGLMQLIPETADAIGVTDAFDPGQNVLGGARLLKRLMGRYDGDLGMTLSAYNAGVRPVDAAGGIPMIPETIDYVSRILSFLAAPEGKTQEAYAHSGRESASVTSLRITGRESGK